MYIQGSVEGVQVDAEPTIDVGPDKGGLKRRSGEALKRRSKRSKLVRHSCASVVPSND